MARSILYILAAVAATTPALVYAAPAARPAELPSVPVAWEGMEVEGGEAGPAKLEPVTVEYKGKKYTGAKMTLVYGASYNAIRFPVNVDAEKYNTLQFKIFTEEPDATASLGVQILDQRGGWASTNTYAHTTPRVNNWREFSWDVVYQPDNVMGVDVNAVRRVQLGYAFPSIPKGKSITMTVIDIKFVSGLRASTGDPKLFEKWKQYIGAYKPDYSDSSAYLSPPATGRIAAPIAVTRDGKPLAKIAMPPAPSEPLGLAGRELQKWIGEISGATLPVVTAVPGEKAPRIVLGRKLAAGKFDTDIAWLGTGDGYAIRTRGSDIFIFGATDKGTLNGVFAFLENNTDLIWPRPRLELGAVFSKNPNLKIVWADTRVKPATLLRGWGTNLGLRVESEIWEVRNGNNYALGGGFTVPDGVRRAAQGGYIEYGGGHNISTFLNKDPKFFPEIDGKKPEVFDIWKHQPNFTAPGIAEAVAANVLTYLKTQAPPHVDCINVNIEDNWGVSTDAKSLEPIKLPDGTLLKPDHPAFRSTQYFIFLNKVAQNIGKVHPNLMIGTYAYFFTATAPMVPIDPRIRVYLCPYVRKDHRSPLSSPINDHWWRQLEAWTAMSPNVVLREYYGIMNGFRPLAEVVAFDVKSYLPKGAREYTAEINPDEEILWDVMRGGGAEWDFMAMEFWIINRLYWDPNQDVEKLRKYYLRRTYREAAPAMEKFFGKIREEWFKMKGPSDFAEPDRLMNQMGIPGGLETDLIQYLDEARKSAKHPVSALTVDVVRARFDEWLGWAKDRSAMEAAGKITIATRLRYGWGPDNDWGQDRAWCTATFIRQNDKTVPAVRIAVKPPGKAETDAAVSLSNLPDLKAGDTLCFTIHPAKPLPPGKTLRLTLAAIDKNETHILGSANTMQAQPDGSIKVRWPLKSPAGAEKPFDPTKLPTLSVSIANESVSDEDVTLFYLTDVSVKNEATA